MELRAANARKDAVLKRGVMAVDTPTMNPPAVASTVNQRVNQPSIQDIRNIPGVANRADDFLRSNGFNDDLLDEDEDDTQQQRGMLLSAKKATKSGMDIKLKDKVLFPQRWPHSASQ